jgi:uncharacterized protein (TIGR04255 family)
MVYIPAELRVTKGAVMAVGRDDEIYPNSPLVNVACELRFAGEIEVETQRHVFWGKIRDDYPNVFVPAAVIGQPPALQHYQFGTDDKSRLVAVALNSLAFGETKYSGHCSFIKEFSRVAKIFAECYPQIDKLKRVGWRYINIIPFQREDGLVPVGRFFKTKAKLPFDVLARAKNFDARFESEHDGGVAVIRLAVVTNVQMPGIEAIQCDLDYAYEGKNLRMRNFATKIESARKCCRSIFEELVTVQYRSYLRGGKR